jgi:hypothetical protein
MEAKDLIAIIGIGLTFFVSAANFLYSWRNNKRTSFVNTVTTSRLKWIDSLRDKVCEFIAVTHLLDDPNLRPGNKDVPSLLLQRDTLLHEIVLHLNPHDSEDGKIREVVSRVQQLQQLSDATTASPGLSDALLELRDATGEYLKKEWNRVKRESTGRPS